MNILGGLSLLWLACVLSVGVGAQSFAQGDTPNYLAAFPNIIKNEYSMPLPDNLRAACVNTNVMVNGNINSVFITSNTNAQGLQNQCGSNNLCVINNGVTVNLDGNVNVAAILVKVI